MLENIVGRHFFYRRIRFGAMEQIAVIVSLSMFIEPHE
jgi:hypothetical protein